jgi:hypothetical protein
VEFSYFCVPPPLWGGTPKMIDILLIILNKSSMVTLEHQLTIDKPVLFSGGEIGVPRSLKNAVPVSPAFPAPEPQLKF